MVVKLYLAQLKFFLETKILVVGQTWDNFCNRLHFARGELFVDEIAAGKDRIFKNSSICAIGLIILFSF